MRGIDYRKDETDFRDAKKVAARDFEGPEIDIF